MPQYIPPIDSSLLNALINIERQKAQRQPYRDIAQSIASASETMANMKILKQQEEAKRQQQAINNLIELMGKGYDFQFVPTPQFPTQQRDTLSSVINPPLSEPTLPEKYYLSPTPITTNVPPGYKKVPSIFGLPKEEGKDLYFKRPEPKETSYNIPASEAIIDQIRKLDQTIPTSGLTEASAQKILTILSQNKREKDRNERLSKYYNARKDEGFASLDNMMQQFIKNPYLMDSPESQNIIKEWYKAMRKKGYDIEEYKDTMIENEPQEENKGLIKSFFDALIDRIKGSSDNKATKNNTDTKKNINPNDPLGLGI